MALIDHVGVAGWQDLFSSIIEDADSNILLLDDEFRVISLNPGFYWIFLETYGVELKKGESIIETLETVNARLTSDWQKRCVMALAGSPIKVEEAFEIDGRTYYWEIHFKASKGPVDAPVISVFSRDITVRKAYQKKIIENEANVRSILNTIDDSIWLVNTSFELIDFNKEFYKRYKQAYGVKLMKGENILTLIPDDLPELREQWRQRYETGLRGRPGKYYESFEIGAETRNFEIKVFPIVENSEVRGLTVYARDITSQTRAEDLLKQQNEELTRINAELDRFVYSASHDLRAPLMSVKGLLNMIKLDPDDDNRNHYLSLIEQSVCRLDNFILDIINYSRNSRMQLIPKAIDFHALLDESIEGLKYMDGADQVKTIRVICGDSPFYSDYSRLLILCNNVISNAVRYRDTTKDNSFLRIEITLAADHAVLEFRDNGVGIDSEYLDNVFKMFFRANADSKGSGLGLYIVKGVVEKMNGTVEVESVLGQGTTFCFKLPNFAHYAESLT
jgi:PAS domain S-box-containing protein